MRESDYDRLANFALDSIRNSRKIAQVAIELSEYICSAQATEIQHIKLQQEAIQIAKEGLSLLQSGQKRTNDAFEKFIKESGTKEERLRRAQNMDKLNEDIASFRKDTTMLRKKTKDGMDKILEDFSKSSKSFYKKMRAANIIDANLNIIG